MSNNVVSLVSDNESDTSSILGMKISLNSHLLPISHDHLKPEVISLTNDSDSERVSSYSLKGGTSSSDSLDSLYQTLAER